MHDIKKKKLINRGFYFIFFFFHSEKGVNKQVEEKFNSIGQFSLRLVHERLQKQPAYFVSKRREERKEGKA